MTGLGAFVRARRETLGLTTTALGAAIGKSQTWVSRLEAGRLRLFPDPATLRALAAALDVTPAALLIAAGYLDPS